MPMFDSEEAFEAYVAQQQAELTADEPEPTPQQQPSAFGSFSRVLSLTVPVLITAAALTYFFTQKHEPKYAGDTWDKILGTTAWATGREYNANADSLTERLTLRKKGDKRANDR